MSRAERSARPPYPPDGVGLARQGNASHHEELWTVERVTVGESVHILAVCRCPSCRGIRDEQDFLDHPQHRWFGKCNLPDCEVCAAEFAALRQMAAEDANEQVRRQEARDANRRFREASPNRSE